MNIHVINRIGPAACQRCASLLVNDALLCTKKHVHKVLTNHCKPQDLQDRVPTGDNQHEGKQNEVAQFFLVTENEQDVRFEDKYFVVEKERAKLFTAT